MHKIQICAGKKMTLELELNINELLPPEVLLQVFHHLPPSSLLSAVLVCRLWHGLAHQAPQLWAWLHLTGWCQSTHTSAFLFSNLFQSGQLISPQFSMFLVQPALLCFAGFSLPKKYLPFQSMRQDIIPDQNTTRLEEPA